MPESELSSHPAGGVNRRGALATLLRRKGMSKAQIQKMLDFYQKRYGQ